MRRPLTRNRHYERSNWSKAFIQGLIRFTPYYEENDERDSEKKDIKCIPAEKVIESAQVIRDPLMPFVSEESWII